jgi:hypothetical protein
MGLIENIQKNIKKLESEHIKILGVAQEGICLEISFSKDIDVNDFIEEIGQYFFKIDNPVFGQKFVSSETKDYIYHWLIELFNTGNYEENDDKTILIFNMEIDFNKVGTFKFACQKYQSKLAKDKAKGCEDYVIVAEEIAIEILTLIENIKSYI